MKDHIVTRRLLPVPGRTFATPSDHAKDYFKLGSNRLQNSKSLANYASKRLPHFKSRVTTNDFSSYMTPKPPTDPPPPANAIPSHPDTPPLSPLLPSTEPPSPRL